MFRCQLQDTAADSGDNEVPLGPEEQSRSDWPGPEAEVSAIGSAIGKDGPVGAGIGVFQPGLPVEQLEGRILELAGNLAAAECQFLLLIEEFDRRRGWAVWGVKTCAHWLNWRCGLDLGAARERLRVARRLVELPAVTAAFARGELSYAKVRAITRAATPTTEETLLMWAQYGTASQLERIVRGFRRAKAVEEVAQAVAQHNRRYLKYFHDDDGSLNSCPDSRRAGRGRLGCPSIRRGGLGAGGASTPGSKAHRQGGGKAVHRSRRFRGNAAFADRGGCPRSPRGNNSLVCEPVTGLGSAANIGVTGRGCRAGESVSGSCLFSSRFRGNVFRPPGTRGSPRARGSYRRPASGCSGRDG